VQRLHINLHRYLEFHPHGHLFLSPADISWGPDILVQPDLFVVDVQEARALDWAKIRTLLLTVEVSSPTTGRHDRFTKRRLYQEIGIPLYWIVDPERRLVEVWTPTATLPVVERERIVWSPQGAQVDFGLELKELFKPI